MSAPPLHKQQRDEDFHRATQVRQRCRLNICSYNCNYWDGSAVLPKSDHCLAMTVTHWLIEEHIGDLIDVTLLNKDAYSEIINVEESVCASTKLIDKADNLAVA